MKQYKVLLIYIISNGQSKKSFEEELENMDWNVWESKTSSPSP